MDQSEFFRKDNHEFERKVRQRNINRSPGPVARIPNEGLAIAAFTVRIIGFDRMTRFCGRCGKEIYPFRTERSKQCSTCGLVTYPGVSPAIIVQVQRDDRILLVRSARFSPGMFGLVAGFVDPGEDLEHSLVRDLLEETVITV